MNKFKASKLIPFFHLRIRVGGEHISTGQLEISVSDYESRIPYPSGSTSPDLRAIAQGLLALNAVRQYRKVQVRRT